MLRSNLCDYADAYILVKGTITITGAGNDDAAKRLDERNKGVIFKCGIIVQYYRDDPNDNIRQYESFKSKIKITEKAPAVGNAKDVEIIVPLKYLNNF